MRSFTPPTRDKMIIWSAVVAGCGIMALLGRHAAIYRFGTDEFTGNILFAVFFILLIGLYVSIQPVFEAIFKRLFPQRTPAIMVAEMPNGEQAAIPANDESVEIMQCTSDAPTLEYEVSEDNVEFDEKPANDKFEVVDCNDNGFSRISFAAGSEAYVGDGLTDDEILAEKNYFDRSDDDYPEENSVGRYNLIPHDDNSHPLRSI